METSLLAGGYHIAPLCAHTYTQAVLHTNTVHMPPLIGRRLRRQLQYFNYEYASSAPMNDDRSGAYKFSVIYWLGSSIPRGEGGVTEGDAAAGKNDCVGNEQAMLAPKFDVGLDLVTKCCGTSN